MTSASKLAFFSSERDYQREVERSQANRGVRRGETTRARGQDVVVVSTDVVGWIPAIYWKVSML